MVGTDYAHHTILRCVVSMNDNFDVVVRGGG